jgi:hypothetical protein
MPIINYSQEVALEARTQEAEPFDLQHNKLVEIIGNFGGADQLRNAVYQMQTLQYAS